ncbi:MAG: hypothetical protein IPM48_14965 [Saprospiraceae bacterium]|nr:hypothetical protein [Saprospiraceae bacterium]
MAKLKTIKLPNKTEANYWRITKATLDFDTNVQEVTVVGFATKQDRLDAYAPLKSYALFIEIPEDDLKDIAKRIYKAFDTTPIAEKAADEEQKNMNLIMKGDDDI